MDNPVFNYNGISLRQLTLALELYMFEKWNKFAGWRIDPIKGFILYWSVPEGCPEINKFPGLMSSEMVAPMIFAWIHSNESKSIPLSKQESMTDHDGDNELGFRIYTESWGRINSCYSSDAYSILAVKPCYLWFGK